MVRRRCGNAENIKQTQRDRKNYAPRQLPRERPRALTCPLEESSRSWNPFKILSVKQQTSDQSQSALIARLPPEIRYLIWAEVMGGHLFHIARAHKRLLAIKCAENFEPDLETRFHGCWGRANSFFEMRSTASFYIGQREGHPAKPANLLPLLQTCRITYTETISVLYTDNIFDINHVDTLLYLRQSVLPQRLKQIRLVNFIWNFTYSLAAPAPYDLATWCKACNILASFSGLQELSVHLTGTFFEFGAHRKEEWEPLLDALRVIKATKKFDVLMPWSEDVCAEVAKEGGYPFRLAPRV
jgi:hypothetical protein